MADAKKNERYSENNYEQGHVPPATPPTVNGAVSAREARNHTQTNGDSDFPGQSPPEAPAPDDDSVNPRSPDEVNPGEGGDTDKPGKTPDETVETPKGAYPDGDGAGEQALDSMKPATLLPPD